jgi:hypothetical protein
MAGRQPTDPADLTDPAALPLPRLAERRPAGVPANCG